MVRSALLALVAAALLVSSLAQNVIRPRRGHYFLVRPDFRKCASPRCGGWFVRPVNSRFTRCVDGTLQEECYVAPPVPPLGVKRRDIVLGRIKKKIFPGVGTLGVLRILRRFRQAGSKPVLPEDIDVKGNRFVRLKAIDRICKKPPCPTIREQILNTRRTRFVNDFNFAVEDLSTGDAKLAFLLIRAPKAEGLIAFGMEIKRKLGVIFEMKQIYLPVDRVKEVE